MILLFALAAAAGGFSRAIELLSYRADKYLDPVKQDLDALFSRSLPDDRQTVVGCLNSDKTLGMEWITRELVVYII